MFFNRTLVLTNMFFGHGRNTKKWFDNIPGWQIAVFTAVTSLAAYIPTIQSPFFSDDYVYVVGNQNLLSIPLSEFWQFFSTRTNPYEYLPLRDLSFRVDAAIWGVTPIGFHLHNLILYAFCCLFVWLLTAEICRLVSRPTSSSSIAEINQQTWICTLTTCLFAVHPAHVEAVAWISGRKDLLSGLFAFASLWQFTQGINQEKLRPLSLISINDGHISRILEGNPLFSIYLHNCIIPSCSWGSAPDPKVFKA